MVHAELVRLQECTSSDPCYVAREWHGFGGAPGSESLGDCWKVLLTQSGHAIGNAGLLVLDDSDRVAELYFRMEADWASDGIVVASLQALFELGFQELGLLKIRAWCLGTETAPQAAYRLAGMELEEVLPKSRVLEGEWHDSYLFCVSRKQSVSSAAR